MRLVGILLALVLVGCAHKPEAPVGPLELKLAAGMPSNAHADVYANCMKAATSTPAGVDRESPMIMRFQCAGEPAKAFYDALGAFSARLGTELSGEGRTFRTTQKIQRDLNGVDHCSTDNKGDYRCVIVLPTGKFVSEY